MSDVTVTGAMAEPVVVDAEPGLCIDATPGSRGTVVLRHAGPGSVDIAVGDGADLSVVSLQESDADAEHRVAVGRDAHLKHVAVTHGGAQVRVRVGVHYDAPGGSVELFGLYLTDAGQRHEHHLTVDHDQPKTTSRVDYRGALRGKRAHSSWVGDVRIRREAIGTDTYESNRNLLLTPGCVADSVPNLEIETGNIAGAGHSSATGRFDDEQLFYLQSRGLPEADARRLIVQGFLSDVIRRIGVPDIEARLQGVIDAELDIREDKES